MLTASSSAMDTAKLWETMTTYGKLWETISLENEDEARKLLELLNYM